MIETAKKGVQRKLSANSVISRTGVGYFIVIDRGFWDHLLYLIYFSVLFDVPEIRMQYIPFRVSA